MVGECPCAISYASAISVYMPADICVPSVRVENLHVCAHRFIMIIIIVVILVSRQTVELPANCLWLSDYSTSAIACYYTVYIDLLLLFLLLRTGKPAHIVCELTHPSNPFFLFCSYRKSIQESASATLLPSHELMKHNKYNRIPRSRYNVLKSILCYIESICIVYRQCI